MPAATRVLSIIISTMKAMTIPATSPVCEPPPSADSLQVRVELDGRPVQIRRLEIGHDLLQFGGRNLKNLLLNETVAIAVD